MAKMSKLTKIEDQALTVFHFWWVEGPNGERFNRYLNGMFEMLKKQFPAEVDKAIDDAQARRAREGSRWQPMPGAETKAQAET